MAGEKSELTTDLGLYSSCSFFKTILPDERHSYRSDIFCANVFVQGQEFTTYEQTIPGSTVKFTMVPIPAGSFTMGSPANEAKRQPDEGPQKKSADRCVLDGRTRSDL